MMSQTDLRSNAMMRAMAESDERALQRSRHAITVRLLPDQFRALEAEAARYGISLAAAASVRMFKESNHG